MRADERLNRHRKDQPGNRRHGRDAQQALGGAGKAFNGADRAVKLAQFRLRLFQHIIAQRGQPVLAVAFKQALAQMLL